MFTVVSQLIEERLPHIDVSIDRIKAKDRVHRIQANVMLYCDFRFGANKSARRLWAMVVCFKSPLVEKTPGADLEVSRIN